MNNSDPTNDDALWDADLNTDAELSRLGEALRSESKPHEIGARIRARRRARALAFPSIIVLIIVGAAFFAPRESPWTQRSLSAGAGPARPFARHQWIETDSASLLEIACAGVGRVTVSPGSRVRLAEASDRSHRLELARGELSALITAAPTIFAIDTPAGRAIDMGCAYTVSVDDDGTGTVRVTFGWVELVRSGRKARVPAGAECVMDTAAGPRLPVAFDASAAVRDAAARLDLDIDDDGALADLIAASAPCDAITLWHLLARVAEDRRGLVADSLAAHLGRDAAAERSLALALDPATLESWWSLSRGTLR